MRRLIEQLFGGMPREFATPQRTSVDTTEELLRLVDQHNGVTKCYVGAYSFCDDEERSYSSVLINKAIFDFDDEWGELVSTHEWLEERGASHLVVFSGSDESGHIYILTEPTTHQQSLEYFQRDIIVDGADLRKCNSCGAAVRRSSPDRVAKWVCGTCDEHKRDSDTRLVVDENLIGDPTTMIRVPNTWHTGAERFCIPLKPDEVTRDVERVYELAQEQRDLDLSDVVCGDNPVDIEQRREKAEDKYYSVEQKRRLTAFDNDRRVLDEFDVEVPPVEILDDIDCECVRSLILDGEHLTRPRLGHHNRRVLVSFLVEKGYNPAEIAEFLRYSIDEEKARHSIVDEEQPVRIWRDGIKAPNRHTLKREGLLNGSCPVHSNVTTGNEKAGCD